MSEQKKILFIGLSCVGDVIMTTPVMESLHKAFPNARLDVVGDGRSSELYLECPYVNHVYIKDKKSFLRGTPALLLELWPNHYDIVVDVRTDGLAYLLRAEQRYTKRKSVPYGPHAVEKTMGVIAALHGNQPIPDTTVWLNETHRAYANQKLSAFANTGSLLAISTGEPSKPEKNWTTEKWVEFIERNKSGFSGLVLLGGPNEHAATDTIKNKIDIPLLDLVGNSLLETAAILEKVCLYIGPDSGLGHLASAVKTATISLFSNFTPEQYQPWGRKALSVTGARQDARNISVAEMEKALALFLNNNPTPEHA